MQLLERRVRWMKWGVVVSPCLSLLLPLLLDVAACLDLRKFDRCCFLAAVSFQREREREMFLGREMSPPSLREAVVWRRAAAKHVVCVVLT